MPSGGFNGSTFSDQIERVYRNVMSNQREFIAQLGAAYTTGSTTLSIVGDQAKAIQLGSILAIDQEVFLVQAVSASSQAGVTTYTVSVTYAYEGSTNANHNSGTAVYINPKYTRWAIGVALNDALNTLSAPGFGLMREAYTTITYNPVLRGYDLASAGVPANFHTILGLRYDLPDPSHYFPTLRSFQVARGITSSKIPGGYALFVNQSAMPGLPMMLAYGAPFIQATSITQDMNTDLGVPLTCLDLPAMRAEIDLTLVREIKRNFTEATSDPLQLELVTGGQVLNSYHGLQLQRQQKIQAVAAGLLKQYGMPLRVL